MGSVGNNTNSFSFSEYRVDKVSDLSPIRATSNLEDNSQKEKQLQDIIDSALSAGYEYVERPYTTTGGSGTMYHWTERTIETKVTNGKISTNSKLGKHLKDTLSNPEYKEVIVLQTRLTRPTVGRGRRGFKSAGDSATYVVMAKKR